MIWLTWRQFRVQALGSLLALLVLAIYLVILGFQIRNSYDTDIIGCLPADCVTAQESFTDTYGAQVHWAGALLIGVPALIGLFWGAPLITRELEDGTHRLVWNQSVTRTHWLATKLAFIALVSMATAGLFSLLLTWSASRFDQVAGDRFATLTYDSRNIVPIGYALFAFVLGTIIGLLVRRTLPAMALTLAVFTVLQVLVPTVLRAHLISPVTSNIKFTTAVMDQARGFDISEAGASVERYILPGAWSLSTNSTIFNADGTKYTAEQAKSCTTGDPENVPACMEAQNLHFEFVYQPASRYWPFQWIELSAYTVLALLLAGFGFWWIRFRPS